MKMTREDEQQVAYGKYIMDHCAGDRLICNGDTLLQAIEDGYLWEDFLEHSSLAE